MSRTKSINRAGAAALLAAGVTAVLCLSAPAWAQEASDQAPTAFGYEMPQHYLVNRMMDPSRPEATGNAATDGGKGQAGGAAGGQAANNDDDNDSGPYPKRYLLNRMFGWGGRGDAPAPAAGPASAAKSP